MASSRRPSRSRRASCSRSHIGCDASRPVSDARPTSFSSAVGGLAVPKPAVLEQVVPISLGFLAFIFLIQRFGAHRISVAYAPVTAIWLLLLGGCGITNIVSHPAVFRAFDPSRAVMFFVRTRNYDALAGILLSVTGCEGLYSNLGSFNAVSPRFVTWLLLSSLTVL